MVPRTSSMNFLTLLVKDMVQTGANILLILARVEAPKFLIPIKESGYLVVSWQARHGVFGRYWLLVLLCCDISSLLVPLGSRSMSTATGLNFSLP